VKSDTVPAKRALTKGKRPQRESLPDRPPFTLESLRQLLAEEVIRRQQTMPGDAEITELARILNYWQGHYLIEQKSRALRELQRDALAALATLANVFPRLRDLTESFEANAVQDQAPPAILAILRKRLAEIDAARDFIAKAEGFSVWADPSLAPDRWQWLADVLPIDFENAMRSTDPNYKARLSHNGPLARFIAAVVPSLTGQHPTPDSVATQLKKLRKLRTTGI
jgi:hypothetical protein